MSEPRSRSDKSKTVKYLIVVPAYARDYADEKSVLKAWSEHRDFEISDVSTRYNGAMCNIDQVEEMRKDGYVGVKVRYNELSEFVFIDF